MSTVYGQKCYLATVKTPIMSKIVKDIMIKTNRPFTVVEDEVGIPRGTLSKVIRGERDLPKKWEDKLEGYLFSLSPAIMEVFEFCKIEGIEPIDLVNNYKQHNILKGKYDEKFDYVALAPTAIRQQVEKLRVKKPRKKKEAEDSLTKWLDFRKKKLGF